MNKNQKIIIYGGGAALLCLVALIVVLIITNAKRTEEVNAAREETENLRLARDRKERDDVVLRDIAVVEVFFATGARVYEVSNIKLENVNLKSGTIRFMGKGGKERCVQIGSEAVKTLLYRYYERNRAAIQRSGYFFVNQRGRRFTEQSIRNMLKKYTVLAGIQTKITPHMFRHSFATYLIEEGVDISCVQQILGHSSIKTTQIYIHVAARRQAEILRDFHPRNRMKIEVE